MRLDPNKIERAARAELEAEEFDRLVRLRVEQLRAEHADPSWWARLRVLLARLFS